MKNRVKFVITLILLLIILLAMCLGVYAMVTYNADVTGTVTYYVDSISASIFGEVKGYDELASGGKKKIYQNSISPSSPQGMQCTWDIGDLSFSKDKTLWGYLYDENGNVKRDINGNAITTPTITIRLVIANLAPYKEQENQRMRIYIGNIVAPEENDNLIYSYRKAYGALLEDSGCTNESPFYELRNYADANPDVFKADEKVSLNPTNAQLNSYADKEFIECRQVFSEAEGKPETYSYYYLDFMISVKDTSVPVNDFTVQLSLNLSCSQL